MNLHVMKHSVTKHIQDLKYLTQQFPFQMFILREGLDTYAKAFVQKVLIPVLFMRI